MKQIVKLEIYDRFKCSADQCPFTCCEDWEIDVDSNTYRKWKEHAEIAKTLPKNVGTKKGKQATQHYIKMNSRNICPYLDSNKLCTLVIEQGEDFIPLACRTFPRVNNNTPELGEISLSCACPEVVDLLKKLDNTVSFVDESNTKLDEMNLLDADIQLAMIRLFRIQEIPLRSRILLTFHMLLHVKAAPDKQKEILERYESQKYLAGIEKLWSDNYDLMDQRLWEDSFIEISELFLDIVENYSRQPKYRGKLKEIAELSECLLEGTAQKDLLSYIKEYKLEFFEKLKQYELLLTNCIITKIFANCCNGDIDDIIFAYQIMITEYVLIIYSAFLKYKQSGDCKADLYTLLRDYIVVYSRIIEYNTEGMKEFWAESFEEASWEMGYLLLLLS